MKKAMAAAAKAEEERTKKLGNNHDLVSETGLNSLGVMPSHMLTGGPSGYGNYIGGGLGSYEYMKPGMGMGGPSSKIAMLMGFNHLNTIEEEKHETQTSNYFREGGDSERDDSKNHNNSNYLGKTSRILDDD